MRALHYETEFLIQILIVFTILFMLVGCVYFPLVYYKERKKHYREIIRLRSINNMLHGQISLIAWKYNLLKVSIETDEEDE